MPSRTIRSVLVASAATIALAVGATSGLAETKDSRPAPEATQKMPSSATRSAGALAYQFRASEIIGKTVKDAQNETVGTIDDLVIGRDDKVVYAILSVGGFLGLGDKLVAVRYDELKREGKGMFVFNETRDELKARPAFKYQTADASASDKSADAYRKQMGAEVDAWKTKVDTYSSKAKEKGTAASQTAAQKLDRAWDNVKTQWNKVQNATDDSWDDTKAAFEKAWRDFQDTWKSTTSSS